ncbi:MAG TPA: DUF6499 domain-containing protein [Thermoanaerobaculia bacterium]
MPDWHNPDDYDYAEKLQLHDWAWEFLRRNPAYRLAWDRFLVAVESDRRAVLASQPDKGLYDAMDLAYKAASEEFGLIKPVDPDHSAMKTAEELELAWWNVGGVGILQDWNQPRDSSRPWPGYPRSIALSFDFTLPLEAQIEHAKGVLLRCRNTLQTKGFPWEDDKPKVRVNRQRFLLYLRLLDAERAGTSLGEMGRRLFKNHGDNRKSAKNALQQARWMSEAGYRELLLMVNR